MMFDTAFVFNSGDSCFLPAFSPSALPNSRKNKSPQAQQDDDEIKARFQYTLNDEESYDYSVWINTDYGSSDCDCSSSSCDSGG